MPAALSPMKVARIKVLLKDGFRPSAVAREMGVSDQCISSLRKRGFRTGARTGHATNQWDVATGDPTQEQITERAAEVREAWTDKDYRERLVGFRINRVRLEIVDVGVFRYGHG